MPAKKPGKAKGEKPAPSSAKKAPAPEPARKKPGRKPGGVIPPGAPRLIPDALIEKALRKYKGLIKPAAQAIGCSVPTIYERLKVRPELARAREEAQEGMKDTAELKLYKAIAKDEAPWAIALFLKTRCRDRGYVERTETRLGGDAAAPPVQTETVVTPAELIKHFRLDDLPPDLLRQLLEHARAPRTPDGTEAADAPTPDSGGGGATTPPGLGPDGPAA